MTSRPLLETKTLCTSGFFKSASSCCQFVRIEHGLSMLFMGSLVDFVCINAELLKMIHDS